MTFNHNTASSMPLFHKNLLTLNDVFKLESSKSKLMHNMESNEHLSDYISKFFERVDWKHNYNTRHSYKGNNVLPKIRMETGKKSILYCGPKIWQQLPPDLKSKPMLLFKKIYANHLISKYINTWCLQSMDVGYSRVMLSSNVCLNFICRCIASIISTSLFVRIICSCLFCSSFWYHKRDQD